MAVQPDGRIVVAGDCDMGATGFDFCVARYTAGGALDTSFNLTGKQSTAIGSGGSYDAARAITLQADGKILVAGLCDVGGSTGRDFCVVRYTSTGGLDPSFGSGGIATTNIAPGTGADSAYAVGVADSGSIVLAGECAMGASGTDLCLAMLTAYGIADTSFNGTGKVSTAVGPGAATDVAYSLAVAGGGRIVVAGQCAMGGATGNDMCIARYNPTGTLDTGFNGTGVRTTSVGPGATDDVAFAIGVHGDGQVVAAGACDMAGGTGVDACLVRYTSSGALDTSFNTTGVRTVSLTSSADVPFAMSAMGDGKLVVAGVCTPAASGDDFCVAQLGNGGTVSQYASGSADWTTPNADMFGACLRATSGGGLPGWTPDAACAPSNGTYWNAVPGLATQVAYTSGPNAAATASLRFGLRLKGNQGTCTIRRPDPVRRHRPRRMIIIAEVRSRSWSRGSLV